MASCGIMGTQIREEKVQCQQGQQGQQGPNFDEAAARRLHHLYHHQVPVPKAWARVTKHSDCFKSKGHQDWKAAEILCAPLLVCTVSSQILNYVFPGNRKRRKKQLKNDAKKTEHTKEKRRKKTYTKKTAHSVSYCLVALFAFVCFCFVSLFWFAFLACVRILWHLHGCFFCRLCVCMWFCFCCACFFPQFVLLFFICFHKRINLLDSRIF